MKNVYIIGSKGIPANYGGFETFVENLTGLKKSPALHYYVACLSEEESTFSYNDATCFNVPVPNVGPGKAILYDLKALKWVIAHVKENNVKSAVVYILACRIGPFLAPYLRKLHQLGVACYLNPDGHEWLRAKWSKPVRHYWKLSEKMMVRQVDLVICDSINIEKYIHKNYESNRLQTCFVPYGATVAHGKGQVTVDQQAWFDHRQVELNAYYLVVGRFVPENNYETMIKEFMRSKTQRKLVIVTNVEQNRFYDDLEQETHFSQDSRIQFVGTVYDQKLLKVIRENAFAYLHGHEVGGTNPSLLEALASTPLNLLLNVGFNHEVGAAAAKYWTKNQGSLSKLINEVDTWDDPQRQAYGTLAKDRITQAYNWDNIVSEYEAIFLGEKS
ncbi:beta 1-4 rhamnosyltransferase Cps2T [Levilactobacillus fujinensis]|uniref:Beta 1-4 rhamnosyltransferase Cps2T n=1 Tax=Levilactobacillus fujinensis TaxID=2486024 RepID=A0ABW1TFL8_9LACO|nr:DUF1972 domain-containing protein [Levilactobacillus fujinensis]